MAGTFNPNANIELSAIPNFFDDFEQSSIKPPLVIDPGVYIPFPDDLGSSLDQRHFMSITVSEKFRSRLIEKGTSKEETNSKPTTLGTCYLPITPVGNSFGAGWSTLGMGVIGAGAYNFGRSLGERLRNTEEEQYFSTIYDTLKDKASELKMENVFDALKATGLRGLSFTVPGIAVQAGAGVAVRNFQVQTFDSMSFREFQFQWSFVAKNKTETENLRKIEKLLKMGMHPSYSNKTGTILDYPSEFFIKFFSCEIVGEVEGDVDNRKLGSAQINDYLPKIAPCVLTNMSFVYNPSTTSFRKEDGSPLEISVSLNFRETEIIERSQIKNETRS